MSDLNILFSFYLYKCTTYVNVASSQYCELCNWRKTSQMMLLILNYSRILRQFFSASTIFIIILYLSDSRFSCKFPNAGSNIPVSPSSQICYFCCRWRPEPEFTTSSTSSASLSLKTRGTRRWPDCAAAGNSMPFTHFLSEESSSDGEKLWKHPYRTVLI